ncbi:MAG: heme exporter protein CcmB [Gammaproteobacteria bacterium]|nr:heme exporter protein CcmB [Gammaproteobacteria bacterium]MDH3507579.1 heme exporter protein CcmB [Gammaproteobacteria bacterium]
MSVFTSMLERDLRLAMRRWSEFATPLIFFVIISSLFPFALSPEVAALRAAGTGVLWIAALLSSLLALDGLFRTDMDDGSMEQLILSPASLGLLVFAKICAHWLVSGLPLILIAPVLALSFYLPPESLPTLMFALLLATPTLSALAAIGAALTVGLRSGGTLIGLLVLPLTAPVLIFGTRATDMAVHGESALGPLYLLGALAAFSLSLAPLASAAAIRVSVE